MKKLKLFVFGLLFMFVAVVSVNADTRPTYVKNGECVVNNATDLEAAITAKWGSNNGKSCDEIIIEPGSNITLDKDLTFNGDGGIVAREGNIVLDLNEKTITLAKFNNISIEDTANVILKNGNIIQKSKGWSAIDIFHGAKLETSALNITVNGKYDAAEDEYPRAFDVSGLGTNEIAKLVISADTTINVPNGNGLTLSSFANVTLNGTWNTARSIIPDDNQATKNTYVTFAGGTYNVADGIAIPITRGNWVFNGGSFISNNNDAVHINAPVKGKNNVAAPDALTVVVNNGVFETKSDVHKPLHAETLNGFVYGGEFRAPKVEFELPTAYIAEGYGSFVTKQNNTIVGKVSNIIVEESKNGKASVDMNSAVAGQEITITLNADQGYELESLIVTDANGNSISVENGKFIMPSSDVTVKATFKKQAKAIVNNVSNPNTSDSILISVVIGVIGLVSLAGCGIYYIKRYQ